MGGYRHVELDFVVAFDHAGHLCPMLHARELEPRQTQTAHDHGHARFAS